MHNLDTVQMREVAETFIDSYNYVLGNYIKDTKNTIIAFTADIVLRNIPFMILSPEGVPHITHYVFGKDEHRDFVLTLHYVFFSRWGHSDIDLDGLMNNMARGVAMSNVLDMNSMPNQLKERLVTFEDAAELLKANKWMAIILMMQLFITVEI